MYLLLHAKNLLPKCENDDQDNRQEPRELQERRVGWASKLAIRVGDGVNPRDISRETQVR